MLTNEQLIMRRSGIGGSDVAAVLGLSKFRSPLDVYLDKTNEDEPVETGNDATYWGSTLEDLVAKEFAKRTGKKVQRVNATMRAGENGWMIANIDRAIVNPAIAGNVRYKDEKLTTDSILECKTASVYVASQWGPSQENEIVKGEVVTEHKIPIYYETQVQWYMGITGATVCYVAVLIGGNDFRIYQVKRDDELIKAITEKCKSFWFDNVLAQQEPMPANVEDTLKMFPTDNGEMSEATNEQSILIGEIITLTAQQKELKDQTDELKSKLIASIGDKQGLTIAGEKACTYKAQVSKRFDSTAFKKADIATYEKYLKETSTRVLRF